jgi:hypothetical protein
MTFFAVILSFGGINDAQEHVQHGFETESLFVPSTMPDVMWSSQ